MLPSVWFCLPQLSVCYFALFHTRPPLLFFFFFLNDPPTPEIYPLPLHAALPISPAPSRGLLLPAALYVTADALADARDGDRFLSWLGLAAAGAALASLLQVLACPSPVPAHGLARWFFHRCDRARGFFSIYMTLAGVLSIALLALLPRLLPGRGLRLMW